MPQLREDHPATGAIPCDATGFAGPKLLANILFEKFGQHQPLNRQSERYAREGIDLSVSTLADQVGACAVALKPLHALIEAHVLAAERLHGDDTTVPILARGKTVTGHIWVYVRDDGHSVGGLPRQPSITPRAIAGRNTPNTICGTSPASCRPMPMAATTALRTRPSSGTDHTGHVLVPCRRQFFELADIAANARRGKMAAAISPIALEAVKRIDALFDIERDINGLTADQRLGVRRERSLPLLASLETWLRDERAGCHVQPR